jgi:hypothetical protein
MARVCASQIAHEYLRPVMTKDISLTMAVLALLPVLLYDADRAVWDFLSRSDTLRDCPNAVGPAFAVPWYITWFAHHVKNFDVACRIYDFFLASHPLMPLYFSAAIVLQQRDALLSTECDFAEVHMFFQQMPQPSMQNIEVIAKQQLEKRNKQGALDVVAHRTRSRTATITGIQSLQRRGRKERRARESKEGKECKEEKKNHCGSTIAQERKLDIEAVIKLSCTLFKRLHPMALVRRAMQAPHFLGRSRCCGVIPDSWPHPEIPTLFAQPVPVHQTENETDDVSLPSKKEVAARLAFGVGSEPSGGMQRLESLLEHARGTRFGLTNHSKVDGSITIALAVALLSIIATLTFVEH